MTGPEQIASVTEAYMKAAYASDTYHSMDEIIAYTERVADCMFHHTSKGEVYKAVSIILNRMHEESDSYYF